jgi:hypothetical protein
MRHLIDIVKATDLAPGMLITKELTDRVSQTVGRYSGSCEKGPHFGQGCFDRLGKWYVWEERKK